MSFIDWDDSYSVAVAEFDHQHQRLFELINRLHDAIKNREADQVIGKVLGELADYTKTHFKDEEKEMDALGYPDTGSQKKQHAEFVSKILEFKEQHEQGKLFLSTKILDFLQDWLTKHIKNMDSKYGPFFNAKGVK